MSPQRRQCERDQAERAEQVAGDSCGQQRNGGRVGERCDTEDGEPRIERTHFLFERRESRAGFAAHSQQHVEARRIAALAERPPLIQNSDSPRV